MFELWHLSLDFIVSLNIFRTRYRHHLNCTFILYGGIPSFTSNFVFGFFIYDQTPIVFPNLDSGWKIVQLRLFPRETIQNWRSLLSHKNISIHKTRMHYLNTFIIIFTLSLIITNNRFNYTILMVFSTKCIQISLLKLTLKYFKMKCFNKIDE